jgi:hypothetical protein
VLEDRGFVAGTILGRQQHRHRRWRRHSARVRIHLEAVPLPQAEIQDQRRLARDGDHLPRLR